MIQSLCDWAHRGTGTVKNGRGVDDEEHRFLLVEDHPDVRRELFDALCLDFPAAVVHACQDLPEAQRLLEEQCPSVLIVDVGLPSGSGLQLIRTARLLWGEHCCSLVLTVTGNDEFLVRAVTSGAIGVLYKSDGPAVWRQTVHDVLTGGSPACMAVARAGLRISNGTSPDIRAPGNLDLGEWVASGYSLAEVVEQTGMSLAEARRQMRSLYRSLWEELPHLTPRELELIRLLGKGNSFKESAQLMDIGETTAKTLAVRAYSKLGANNLQTALYEARTMGLLT